MAVQESEGHPSLEAKIAEAMAKAQEQQDSEENVSPELLAAVERVRGRQVEQRKEDNFAQVAALSAPINELGLQYIKAKQAFEAARDALLDAVVAGL